MAGQSVENLQAMLVGDPLGDLYSHGGSDYDARDKKIPISGFHLFLHLS